MSKNLDSMACENSEYKKKHKPAKRPEVKKSEEVKK